MKIICHVVNDRGKWAKGFAVAVSKRWPVAREDYLLWYNGHWKDLSDYVKFELGSVQLVGIGDDIIIANMLAQHGLVGRSNPVPLRYDALQKCLKYVGESAEHISKLDHNISLHMPRIGCGLAGGKWTKVRPIIETELCDRGLPVTVYEL